MYMLLAATRLMYSIKSAITERHTSATSNISQTYDSSNTHYSKLKPVEEIFS